jgi:hypothetical protein
MSITIIVPKKQDYKEKEWLDNPKKQDKEKKWMPNVACDKNDCPMLHVTKWCEKIGSCNTFHKKEGRKENATNRCAHHHNVLH